MKKLALLFVFVQSLVFANNPVITLNGDSVVELYLNSYYDDPGATAFDAEDGDLSDSIVVTGTYDSSTVDSYVLAYSVTDSDGNQSVEIRTIRVVDNSIMSFDVTATHSFSNQGAIGVGDTVIIYVTVKNTGNTNLSVHHGDYILNDFNGNPLLLTSQGWHGDNYNISVGSSLTLESTYVLNQTTLDSGGLEFSINVYDYYWDNNQSIRIDKTSNLLSVSFSGSSDEIILDGQISANNNQIKKVADPTDNLDAVNKRYVDQRTLEQTIPGQNIGDLLYWNGQSWQKLSAPQEQSTLRFCDGQLTWGSCKVDLFALEYSERVQYDDFYFEVFLLPNGEFPLNIGAIISKTNQNPNEQDDTVLMSIEEPEIDNDFRYPNDINFTSSQQFEFQPGETYYVKYFADNVNNLGRSYSDVVTLSTMFEDQNGNTIYSKTYGDQEWSTQNAEVTTYGDGTPIPRVVNEGDFSTANTGVYMQTNGGKFYNWYAIMGVHDDDPNTDNKHFAPEGWHVPSKSEWETLRDYLIANGYNYDGTTTGNKIAKAMASSDGLWSDDDSLGAVGNNPSLNNSSGFYAYPFGTIVGGRFESYSLMASFWTTTLYNQNNVDYVQSYMLHYNSWTLSTGSGPLDVGGIGYSVRFVKD